MALSNREISEKIDNLSNQRLQILKLPANERAEKLHALEEELTIYKELQQVTQDYDSSFPESTPELLPPALPSGLAPFNRSKLSQNSPILDVASQNLFGKDDFIESFGSCMPSLSILESNRPQSLLGSDPAYDSATCDWMMDRLIKPIEKFQDETCQMSTPTENEFFSRYLRKIKYLEKRLEKFLQSNGSKPKRNLSKDWKAAIKYHQAFGNFPCILGHVEEYNEEDWKNCDFSIFIHFGMIHFHPNSPLHEVANNSFMFLLRDGFLRARLENFLMSLGHSDIRVMNCLGCHFVFNKQPDAQFWIEDLEDQIVSDPFLTLETSVYNETWQEMFIHAAAYLNEHTGIQYHLMIYFDLNREEFNMTIILLQRTTPPRFYTSQDARNQALEEEERTQGFVEEGVQTRSKRKRSCRTIRPNLPLPEGLTDDQIAEIYGVRIALRIELDETFFQRQENGAVVYIGPIQTLHLNTLTVFAGTAVQTEEFPQEIVVELNARFFERLRNQFYRLRQ